MNSTQFLHQTVTLGETCARFEQWRRDKSSGSRIPQELWDAAVTLASQHSLSSVRKTLGLSYSELKRRCETARQLALPATEQPSPVSLVALPPGLVPVREPIPPCLELTNASGAQLRLTLPDARLFDPATLISAFLRGSP